MTRNFLVQQFSGRARKGMDEKGSNLRQEFARALRSYESSPNEDASIISVQVSKMHAWPLLCLYLAINCIHFDHDANRPVQTEMQVDSQIQESYKGTILMQPH